MNNRNGTDQQNWDITPNIYQKTEEIMMWDYEREMRTWMLSKV